MTRQPLSRLARTGLAAAAGLTILALTAAPLFAGSSISAFAPVATYQVPGDDPVAEIVAASPDGKTLVYTNSAAGNVGFVDISDPSSPIEDGEAFPVDGSPTSVAITPNGRWALIAVDQSAGDFANPAGRLVILSLQTRTSVAEIDLGGQPDSVAISHLGRYAAITVENQRDEAVDDGDLPQIPPGFLAIVDIVGHPTNWTVRDVDLTGLKGLTEPSDPEPEFVDINVLGIAAVTLQENNAVALVRLRDGKVLTSWSAGSTTHAADVTDDDIIDFSDSITEEREPDAIGWAPIGRLVTANEGDWLGGSRDFSIFRADGKVLFTSGASLEEHIATAGNYDDGRSDNKGVEPEGIEVGEYGHRTFLFVGAERAASVVVYRLPLFGDPVFVQVLDTGDRPEGLLAITKRGLFVTANEDDGTISIFAGN